MRSLGCLGIWDYGMTPLITKSRAGPWDSSLPQISPCPWTRLFFFILLELRLISLLLGDAWCFHLRSLTEPRDLYDGTFKEHPRYYLLLVCLIWSHSQGMWNFLALGLVSLNSSQLGLSSWHILSSSVCLALFQTLERQHWTEEINKPLFVEVPF